jgi:exopolysaccharide production protein ExoZ
MRLRDSFVRNYGRTDFITGFRAIAATMVVIIHTGAFSELGVLGLNITMAGKYGVDIFFVISGFTIAKTFMEAKNYQVYITKRLWRIVPLYFFVITIVTILLIYEVLVPNNYAEKYGVTPDLYNYIFHLSMISYFDYRIASSILGIEWTIPIEVFWYVMLPYFIFYTKTFPRVLIMVLLCLFLTLLASYFSKQIFGTVQPIKWSPIAYGHLFFIGATSYFARINFEKSNGIAPTLCIYFATVIFFLSLIVNFSGRSEVLALSTAIFIVFMRDDRAVFINSILSSKPLIFLGSISYSIYLIHMPIINIINKYGVIFHSKTLYFIIVFGITIILSMITYLFIEKPTNKIGQNYPRKNKKA